MLHKKEFIHQLGELVAIPTISTDIEANYKAIDYIISLISPKAHIQVIQNGNAKILIASNKKSLTPQIGYMVHVDVVAASKELFTMRQENQIVFGRGVSDMKFSIPLGVAHLNELVENNSSLSFSFVVTTDEEIGGSQGAEYLAKVIKWRPKAIIVPDGGDNLEFVNASKGIAQFRIEATGISTHASRVWEGKSAITPLAILIAELEQRYKDNNSRESWKTTVNFGKISGGLSTNQVCDSAEIEIDFRYPETDSFERILEEITEITQPYADQVMITPLSPGLPTFTNPQLPIVQKFLTSFKKIFKQEIKIKPTYGASDAGYFAEYSTPILMIKPVGGDIHMETEWLDLDSTMTFYEATREFLQKVEKEE